MSGFSFFDDYDESLKAREEYTATVNIDTLNEELYVESLVRDYEIPMKEH